MKNNVISLLFLLFMSSCYQKQYHEGLFVNSKKKIIIYNNKVDLLLNDTLFEYNYYIRKDNPKFIFLSTIDTSEKLDIEFTDFKINFFSDSILLIFDDNIFKAQCYSLGTDITSFNKLNPISKPFLTLPKTEYFYIYAYFKKNGYISSNHKIVGDKNVFYVSANEIHYPISYKKNIYWGIEILSRNKIKYLNEYYIRR